MSDFKFFAGETFAKKVKFAKLAKISLVKVSPNKVMRVKHERGEREEASWN